MWKLYTSIYNGDAQYAIIGTDWVTTKRTRKPGKFDGRARKFYIDPSKATLVAQPWYPNYKKAVEFTSSYETLRSCLHEASVNYTVYSIFRVEDGEIKFVLHRRTDDIRMFQYKHHIWRLVGGSPEDIPFGGIPIDPDRICKYFHMRMYTSPGYL